MSEIKTRKNFKNGCSRGDMVILTDRGLMRLDEIGDVKGDEWQIVDDLQVYTDTDKTEFVTKFYVNGLTETRKIITEDGLELESSINHRYRIVNKRDEYVWKRVNQIKEGDKLVTRLGNHPYEIETKLSKIESEKITQPDILTLDIAFFMGLVYGKGVVSDDGVYLKLNKKHINFVVIICKKVFNIDVLPGNNSIVIENKDLSIWLKHNGYNENNIPRIIRMSSMIIAKTFIRGFRSAKCGGYAMRTSSWSVLNINKQFAQDILVLCRSVGYHAIVGRETMESWSLRCSEVNNIRKQYDFYSQTERKMYGNYWLDTIRQIKKSECKTYDIEVENSHHYRLCGNISHNCS